MMKVEKADYRRAVWAVLALMLKRQAPAEAFASLALSLGRAQGEDQLHCRAAAALAGLMHGQPPEDEDLVVLARASLEVEAAELAELVADLARERVARHLGDEAPEKALALTRRIKDLGEHQRLGQISQLHGELTNSLGLGLLKAGQRLALAAQLENRFKADPRDWAVVHSLAVLHWHWAVFEEMAPPRGDIPPGTEKVDALCPNCRTPYVITNPQTTLQYSCAPCGGSYTLADPGSHLRPEVMLRSADGMLCLRCPDCGGQVRAIDSPDLNAGWRCQCGRMLVRSDFVDLDLLWAKAIGYWVYLLGPAWRPFHQWFARERERDCGLSLNQEQTETARQQLADQLTQVFTHLANLYAQAGRMHGAARMRLMHMRWQMEMDACRLLRKEIVPYLKERSTAGDPASALFAGFSFTEAGPALLTVLGEDRELARLCQAMEDNPPSPKQRSDQDLDHLLERLLEAGGDILDSAAKRRLLGGRGDLARRHQGALKTCEEMAAYFTPIGPLSLMARQGSPDDLFQALNTLPEVWRETLLVRYIRGLGHSRLGDLAAGQGLARVKDAVGHWRQALEEWAGSSPSIIPGEEGGERFKRRDEFSNQASYADYVRANIAPGLRVRSLKEDKRIRKGDAGTVFMIEDGAPEVLSIWDREIGASPKTPSHYPSDKKIHGYWVTYGELELMGQKAGGASFLGRRVPVMVAQARKEALEGAAGTVLGLAQPYLQQGRENLHGWDKDTQSPDLLHPEVMNRALEAMRLVLRLLADSGGETDTLAGHLAEGLRAQATMRFFIANHGPQETPSRAEVCLTNYLQARDLLLEAARVYPPSAFQYKKEAAIVCDLAADMTLAKLHDKPRAIKLKEESISLAQDEDYRRQRQLELLLMKGI